jgi:translocation protein SEC63
MGIALPRWIVEAQNNIWVLGVYGLLFGISLPAMVVRSFQTAEKSFFMLALLKGRWWFGNRQKTKDGVHAETAARFFKSLTENSGLDEILTTLTQAIEWAQTERRGAQRELQDIESIVSERLGDRWKDLRVLVSDDDDDDGRWRALVLLHAHLLRVHVHDSVLRTGEQQQLPGHNKLKHLGDFSADGCFASNS